MSYTYPKVYTNLNFYRRSPIDWVKYENKKINALKSKVANTKAETWRLQRNVIMEELKKKGVSLRQMEKIFESYSVPLTHEAMSAQIKKNPSLNPEKTPKIPNNTE